MLVFLAWTADRRLVVELVSPRVEILQFPLIWHTIRNPAV